MNNTNSNKLEMRRWKLKVIRNISVCVLLLTSCLLFFLETAQAQAQTDSSNPLLEPGYEVSREDPEGTISSTFGFRNENQGKPSIDLVDRSKTQKKDGPLGAPSFFFTKSTL